MIERIQQAHALYGRLTGQRVSLRFDRERLWYELFVPALTKPTSRGSSAIFNGRSARDAGTSEPSSFPISSRSTASKKI